MAIYHLSIKIISRGKSKSAVAAAAYRSGEKLINDYDGEVHDYTKKSGIIHTEILLPDHAPREYANRSVLWNAVERVEGNCNSQLARDIEFALPVELSMDQNISLAREYVQNHFVNKGMCADICVHDIGVGNPHAHIMLTMRPIEQDGRWGAKSKKEYILDANEEKIKLPSGEYKSRKIYTVDWNDKSKAEEWREGWAKIANDYLVRNGIAEVIDHRSYERQGLNILPTVHMGVAASQMEKKGIATDRGSINREVISMNKELRQTMARIKKQKTWLFSQPLVNAPSLVDTMGAIADSKNLNTQWQRIKNLQTSAKVLIFLQNNDIGDFPQLVQKVTNVHTELKEVSENIKAMERRINTLSEHLAQWQLLNQHKAIYKKYKELPQKKQDDFYDKHEEEIELFKSASDYFNKILNGRKTIPTKEWQAEQKKLLADRFNLCEKYYKLKEEVRCVEVLQRSAEKLMKEDIPKLAPTISRDIAL